jgi:K+-transporting ATPase KdpF subunit
MASICVDRLFFACRSGENGNHARRGIHPIGHRHFRRRLRLCRAVREDVTAMSIDYILGGIVTIGVMIYLVYALIRPERF